MGEWWLRWFPAQDLAPATLETYAQQYRRHVHPYFGERALSGITGLDLAGFARRLRAQGLAPSTVTVVLSVIRDLLVDAAAEGLIPVAPAVRLRQRRNGAGAPVRPGFAVGAEEVLAVCARLQRPEALMALIAFFTGMRWGEVCGMNSRFLHLPGAPSERARTDLAGAGWYQVDAAAGAVHEDVHARRFFGPPKGGYGRALDLPPFLVGLLAEHCSALGGVDLLFANRRGEPIRHSDFLRRWRPACDGAAQRLARDGRVLAAAIAPRCPGLRFHDLWHCCWRSVGPKVAPELRICRLHGGDPVDGAFAVRSRLGGPSRTATSKSRTAAAASPSPAVTVHRRAHGQGSGGGSERGELRPVPRR
ncbi:site-specific integrase [Actinospica sp. MGRD01-02]|uniref:Site-specific integrase n=1 Tax=Actinospica acidithermotolerans TaxID=2828514 RepID=A0A941E927_9ACTN|nr:site-specific integrase [Actinospica acidithermotolerans]MBR7825775.1 site-specific integrase [Actinospica acidithermotolerans]